MGPAGSVFLLSLLTGILSSDEEEQKNLLKSICGRPAVSSSIASGREANVGQWPWQVSVRQGLFHLCGATLISDQWVLTVASCFWSKDTRKYNILVGSLQAFNTPASRSTIIPVSRIIFYPDFQEDTSSAIAVVELAYPVSFSPVVLPICLPSSAVQLKNSTSCWVTGWGYSGIYHYIKPPYTLKELKVPLIDLQTCSDYYQKKSLLHGVKPNISEAMICSKFPVEQMDQCIVRLLQAPIRAPPFPSVPPGVPYLQSPRVNPGVPGQLCSSLLNHGSLPVGPCTIQLSFPSPQGSRGDPLMCQVEDFWVLAGVMSWESNCIRTSEPGVYRNISFYKSWIEKSAISFTDFSAAPSLHLPRLFPVMLMPLICLVLP